MYKSLDKICHICGKPIYVQSLSNYVYQVKQKDQKKIFGCGYACFKEIRKEFPNRKRPSR